MLGGKINLRGFFSRHRRLFLILIPIILVIIFSAVVWFVGGWPKSETNILTGKKPNSKPTLSESLVNGVKVAPEIANKRVVAAMIENSPAARPQTGLTSADIVYEAVTEGGITRFMAIFQQNLPDKAGPIRSARSYFIDYLSEYDGIYVHEGGSPTALARIKQYSIKNYPNPGDGTYRREPKAGLASEHTLYVNIAKVFQNAIEKKKWPETNNFSPWVFKDPLAPATVAKPITVNFSSSQFQVIWTHDVTTNLYQRSLNGSAHKDAVSGEQIKAQTIVVMTVAHSPNPAYAGTGKESEWTMTTIGEGKASVFQDGIRTDGTWKKPSRTERTRFYDSTGAEIKLDRGKIWVEILPQDGTITAS